MLDGIALDGPERSRTNTKKNLKTVQGGPGLFLSRKLFRTIQDYSGLCGFLVCDMVEIAVNGSERSRTICKVVPGKSKK